jgi:predicted transcriptional regulator
MPRRRTPALTDAELRVMRVLWQRDRATVSEIVEHLTTDPKPAYNTVLTIVGILQRKGYVTREREGRAHAYLPLVDRTEARRTALTLVLNRFFDNSPRELVLDLLGHERLDADELQRVREIIARAPDGGGRAVSIKRRRR